MRVGVRAPAPREWPRGARPRLTRHVRARPSRSARSTPDDKAGLARFFARLSDESRRRRFLGPKPKLSARELAFLTEVDQCRHVALVAVDADGAIVGVGRYATWRGLARAAPRWPSRSSTSGTAAGSARALGDRLVAQARASGLAALTGSTFAFNAPAKALLKQPRLPAHGHLLGHRRVRAQPPRRAARGRLARRLGDALEHPPQARAGARRGARRSAPRSRARRPATSRRSSATPSSVSATCSARRSAGSGSRRTTPAASARSTKRLIAVGLSTTSRASSLTRRRRSGAR